MRRPVIVRQDILLRRSTYLERDRASLLFVEYSEDVMCVQSRVSKWEKLTVHVLEDGLRDQAAGAGLQVICAQKSPYTRHPRVVGFSGD